MLESLIWHLNYSARKSDVFFPLTCFMMVSVLSNLGNAVVGGLEVELTFPWEVIETWELQEGFKQCMGSPEETPFALAHSRHLTRYGSAGMNYRYLVYLQYVWCLEISSHQVSFSSLTATKYLVRKMIRKSDNRSWISTTRGRLGVLKQSNLDYVWLPPLCFILYNFRISFQMAGRITRKEGNRSSMIEIINTGSWWQLAWHHTWMGSQGKPCGVCQIHCHPSMGSTSTSHPVGLNQCLTSLRSWHQPSHRK